MCGENAARDYIVESEKGSSPRVRGKLEDKEWALVHDGLIPACAGKTKNWASSLKTRRAHPRVCGENREIEYFGWYEQGSSPRVRGKRITTALVPLLTRLIPACAGKTGQITFCGL